MGDMVAMTVCVLETLDLLKRFAGRGARPIVSAESYFSPDAVLSRGIGPVKKPLQEFVSERISMRFVRKFSSHNPITRLVPRSLDDSALQVPARNCRSG